MKALLKKWLTGISIPQEYVCTGLLDLQSVLSVFITFRDKNSRSDVTTKHLFLGYKPVVMAIILDKDDTSETNACLHFQQGTFQINSTWKDFAADSSSVARLLMERVEFKLLGKHQVVFYRGVEGTHTFLSMTHRRVNSLLERYRRKPVGNVQLAANLYEQVRIAYSVPRVISIITTYDGQLMNLFPTDLHGAIDSEFYVGSLRIGGEASQQVETHRRIVVSDVDVSQFRQAYTLGKQHMKRMCDPSDFQLHLLRSEIFKFPLPLGVGTYRELEVIEHFDIGIHRIFIYRIVRAHSLTVINTLAHLHRYYTQWRLNRNLTTNYLLR